MGALSLEGLPDNALLLVDSAPITYVLERHPELASVFRSHPRPQGLVGSCTNF